MDHKDLLKVITKANEEVKNSDVYHKLCKEYDIKPDFIDLVPICFVDLDVSARTEKGIIYLNNSLLEDPSQLPHYIMHEITHTIDQCLGEGPTKGSTDDNYLENPAEQRGFRNQTEFISETEGDEEAKNYLNQVLDHHDVPSKERIEKRKKLLRLNAWNILGVGKQLSINFPLTKTKEQLMEEYDKAIENGPKEKHHKMKLNPNKDLRIKKLKEILEILDKNKLSKEASFQTFDIFAPYIQDINKLFHYLNKDKKEIFNKYMRTSFDRIFGTKYADLEERKFFGNYGAAVSQKAPTNESERNFETWHAFFHEILKREVHEQFCTDNANSLQDNLNEDIVSFLQFKCFQKNDSFFAKSIYDKIMTSLFVSKEGKLVEESQDPNDAFNFIIFRLSKILQEVNNFSENTKHIGIFCINYAIKLVKYLNTQYEIPKTWNNLSQQKIVNITCTDLKNSLTEVVKKILFDRLSKKEALPSELMYKFRMWILDMDKFINTLPEEIKLSKEAGLLKYPEKMLNDICTWADGAFATHVKKEKQKKIELNKHYDEYYYYVDTILQQFDYINNYGIESFLEENNNRAIIICTDPAPKELHFKLILAKKSDLSAGEDLYYIQYKDNLNKTVIYDDETLKRFKTLFEKFNKETGKKLEKFRDNLSDFKIDIDDPFWIVETNRLLKECNKYKNISQNSLVLKYSDYFDDSMLATHEVIIELYFDKTEAQSQASRIGRWRDGDFTGMWIEGNHPKNHTILVVKEPIPDTVAQFQDHLKDIHITIRHELQHLIQTAITTQKDLRLNQKGGLPKNKIRDKNVDIHGNYINEGYINKEQRKEHALRDIEYHTRLSDEVQKFNNKWENVDDNIKHAAFLVTVGEKTTPQILSNISFGFIEKMITSDFFKKLKEYSPEKYKNAVKEFYKAIFQ